MKYFTESSHRATRGRDVLDGGPRNARGGHRRGGRSRIGRPLPRRGAGGKAQVLQADTSLQPTDVENLLEDTAYKFDWNSEYGLFDDATNPDNSSSFEKGHGLVDVVAAVRVAVGLDPAPGPSTFPEGELDLPEARATGFIAQWDFVSITEQEFATTCLMLNTGDTPIGRFDITPA